MPRLVIAAPSTGQGKTTIATGLMAALRAAGHEVSGHKVGPDYIDPGYHALATGRPGRNLDPHLVGESRIVPLFLHGARGADVAVVEGVMGLYDGRLGTSGFASTAHVARLLAAPVVLVLDVARQSRTVAAIAAGMVAFDPSVRIAGVVLNQVGSARNTSEITEALEKVGLPVLGAVPRDASFAKPSRHLGLVPAAERGESEATIAALGEYVAAHVDLAALLDVARSAPALSGAAWDPAAELAAAGLGPSSARPVVAMAGGRAFTFRYAETEELLRAAGCEVVTFDPLTAACLPAGREAMDSPSQPACRQAGPAGVYLGGGFPEVYAEQLAANRPLLDELRAAVAGGVPTVAECAGLLLLGESLDGTPMTGALPSHAAMAERLTLRYPVAEAATDSLLTRAGEQVSGHEFHRTATAPAHGGTPAWIIDGAPTGWAGPTLHASYLHTHWAGHPRLAARFVEAVRARG
ncbi:cobyrinate a,c-diamide synthase [Nocardioides ultimimeridianus]